MPSSSVSASVDERVSITIPEPYVGRFREEALFSLGSAAQRISELADWKREGKQNPKTGRVHEVTADDLQNYRDAMRGRPMKDETAARAATQGEQDLRAVAMGRRNRASLEAAKAAGATTFVRESLVRGDDGENRIEKVRVPVAPLEPGFHPDDGTFIPEGEDADRAAAAHFDANQEHNRRVLARLKPHELARFETWLRTRTRTTPPTRPQSRPVVCGPLEGRAPREARNTRRRGSRRGERATSSSSDDPDSDPEPPARRLCAYCGKDIPADRGPKATYCTKRHADRDRQRRKRQRDRERARLPRVPTTADFRRMLELDAETAEKLRQVAVCRCNGSHLEFESGECFRCGHWLPQEIIGGAWLVAAFFERLAKEDRERREVGA